MHYFEITTHFNLLGPFYSLHSLITPLLFKIWKYFKLLSSGTQLAIFPDRVLLLICKDNNDVNFLMLVFVNIRSGCTAVKDKLRRKISTLHLKKLFLRNWFSFLLGPIFNLFEKGRRNLFCPFSNYAADPLGGRSFFTYNLQSYFPLPRSKKL